MNDNQETGARRRLLMLISAAGITSLVPNVEWADDDDKDKVDSALLTITPAVTGLKARVVVVSGGMAGVTAAKYLRLWGGNGLQITLVEPDKHLCVQHPEWPVAERQPQPGQSGFHPCQPGQQIRH